MLDKSPRQIKQYSAQHGETFWQLQTPLTGYRLSGRPYGLDNGCFKRFPEKKWRALVDTARNHTDLCKFVTLPDIVGDARRTRELFDIYYPGMEALPCAIVLQDGVENMDIPWQQISAVFVGGGDSFKVSPTCINCCKVAKMLGKWVHFGRVNTAYRVRQIAEYADSIDGSGMSMYDHMLSNVLHELRAVNKQSDMFA